MKTNKDKIYRHIENEIEIAEIELERLQERIRTLCDIREWIKKWSRSSYE